MSSSRPRTTSFVEGGKGANSNSFGGLKISSKDGSKVMTVIASPGQGPDRSTEVSYTDTKVSSGLDGSRARKGLNWSWAELRIEMESRGGSHQVTRYGHHLKYVLCTFYII